VLQDVTNLSQPEKKIKRKLKIDSSVFSISSRNNIINMSCERCEEEQTSDDMTLDLHKILQGKDQRNTIMIRNIPNRYNQVEFLKIIDSNYKGLYDFVYVPIDFKNHCNIGYAFLSFVNPLYIVDFCLEFHGKKWEPMRSEKIC
jgi:hypothetical protein